MMRMDDLLIALAYFSIPLQIVLSISYYPRLTSMPLQVLFLLILFAFFIFFCGIGHLFRCFDVPVHHHHLFSTLNWITAAVSLFTAIYLGFLIPHMAKWLDEAVGYMRVLNDETETSKRKMVTFMAFLCHEIRNPLFLVTSNLTFLADEPLTITQRRTVSTIDHCAKLMLRLVNDVLDISSLEQGKINFEINDFDLRDLFEFVSLNADSEIRARHKGQVKFCFEMDTDVPKSVQADASRLLQITYNLLSNAAKFTEVGNINFRVSTVPYFEALNKEFVKHVPESGSFDNSCQLQEIQENGKREDSHNLLDDIEQPKYDASFDPINLVQMEKRIVLRLQVSDTGTGIHPDRIDRIFEPYTQCKLMDYRTHGGTGLGLSIVSTLLNQLGGTIRVSSKMGQGTTFVVHFPVRVVNSNDSVSTFISETSNASSVFQDSIKLFRLPSLADEREGVFDDEMISTNSSVSFLEDHKISPLSSSTSSAAPSPLPPPPPPSSLPCSQPLCSPLNGRIQPIPRYAQNNNVILTVDDNLMNRKLLARMLSYYNLEYRQAKDGQEAVDIILQSRNVAGNKHLDTATHYGLIFMDLSMPIMDGYEAISCLRKQHNLTIPIVALTANATEWAKEDALQVGANEVATKPILRDVLYQLCLKYLPSTPASGNCIESFDL